MNRQALVARYIAMQREAELMGIKGSAHILATMSDDEIVRLGQILRARVDEWKARIKEHDRLLSQ
jgi:hypothetical protein